MNGEKETLAFAPQPVFPTYSSYWHVQVWCADWIAETLHTTACEQRQNHEFIAKSREKRKKQESLPV